LIQISLQTGEALLEIDEISRRVPFIEIDRYHFSLVVYKEYGWQ